MARQEKILQIIQYKRDIDTCIHKRHHELAQKYDLSLEQYHLMVELDELMLEVNDEVLAPTVGEIAKSVNNSQNTVSERITRLENKGLVKRVRDSKDRRISRVELTEEGRSFINAISRQASSSFLFDSISNLEDGMIDSFLECLKELLKQMKID